MGLSYEEIHIPHHGGPRFLRMGLVLPASCRHVRGPVHGDGDGGYRVHRYSRHHLPAVWVLLAQVLDRLRRRCLQPRRDPSVGHPQSNRSLLSQVFGELFG